MNWAAASVEESVGGLERDHDFLLRDGVFTPDLIEMWTDFKRRNEIDYVSLRPHPGEFILYFNV